MSRLLPNEAFDLKQEIYNRDITHESPPRSLKNKNSHQVEDFVAYVTNMSSAYRTNNVIITMGEDFNFQVANMWFKNLDKLIK